MKKRNPEGPKMQVDIWGLSILCIKSQRSYSFFLILLNIFSLLPSCLSFYESISVLILWDGCRFFITSKKAHFLSSRYKAEIYFYYIINWTRKTNVYMFNRLVTFSMLIHVHAHILNHIHTYIPAHGTSVW